MPVMDGKAAFEELTRINKGVKVLLCSGYTEEEMASAFGEIQPLGFIHKPYAPPVLMERVQRMVSRATR
jgi:DNA-binding NarL/FixJ family response regulator